MKVPKHKYITCIGRCPKQVDCFHTIPPKESPKCTLTFYTHLRQHMINLITVLEIENE